MNWTNRANLPAPLVSAIASDSYKSAGNISVTGLLRPPRMRVLEKLHWHEIVEDYADAIWRLLGQSVHAILERANTDNHLSEQIMTVEVLGWIVKGQPDLLGPDGTLDDYKVTSVYSFLLGDKPDWEAQLNIYAWMYRKHGFEVKKARIIAILRDWSSTKAMQDPSYPQCAVMVVEIPLWPDAKVQAFVEERVRLHQDAEKMQEAELPPCTAQERWEKPSTWAVMKEGRKTAVRVFDTEAEAIALVAEKGKGHSVVHRPGENVRCARFCRVAQWCPFAKGLEPPM